MRIFLSAGEPSGDIHASNLIRHLKTLHPGLDCVGYGGELMEAAGCQLKYPLSQLALMGITPVLAHIPTFLRLVSEADRYFRHHRPDAVVLIDYPGFNWWIARRAHFHRIPVFYFVPPQLWAWASWRVEKMRRFVDHALCSLPFEETWYRDRGVSAQYVGHPFFDELPHQQLDQAFLQDQRQQPGPIIALLPGSRTQEVKNNSATLIRSAQMIHRARPDVRFLVASFKPHQRKMLEECLRGVDLPIQTFVGRTPEIIELAHTCLAVSGSVSLELLYRNKPTCVVYRLSRFDRRLADIFLKSKYICLVNLLAQRELYPEFLSVQCPAEGISRQALTWLNDTESYDQLKRSLSALRQQVALPGACERTARFILQTLDQRQARAA